MSVLGEFRTVQEFGFLYFGDTRVGKYIIKPTKMSSIEFFALMRLDHIPFRGIGLIFCLSLCDRDVLIEINEN